MLPAEDYAPARHQVRKGECEVIGAQKGRFVSTVVLVLGLGVLGGFALLPSAAATLQPTAKPAPAPDLSTTPKLKSYLRSLGMNPKGFVIQRGERNYAGPDCPGAAWNCTTAQKVVQVPARAAGDADGGTGGENRFVCKPAGVGTNRAMNTCVIVQPGPNSNNSATCDIETNGTEGEIRQTCFITQNGRRNTAVAKQVATMNASGADQDVFQTISVKQMSSASGGNTLETSQGALLSSGPDSSADPVTQDVHQLACVNQDAAGNGPNVARSHQGQGLFVRKNGAAFGETSPTEIDQNTALVTATCIGPATPFPTFPTIGSHEPLDCAVIGTSPPKESANACTRVYQESDTGRNTMQVRQVDSVFAEVKKSTGWVDIDQGQFGETGTDSTLDQKSGGVSKINFDGLTSQLTNIDGSGTIGFYSVDQEDTGPRCCAAGHQETNTGNTFDIDGLLVQRLIVDGTVPNPALGEEPPGNGTMSQDGAVWGDCVTTGNCTVDINATNNADPDGDPASCSAAVCHEQVVCEAFTGEGEFGFCSNTPPDITLRARPR